jgi:hypothetical protein
MTRLLTYLLIGGTITAGARAASPVITNIANFPSVSVAYTNYVSELITTNGITLGGQRNTAWPAASGFLPWGRYWTNTSYLTNIVVTNLATGTNDIWTVPAGKRALWLSIRVGSTNGTSATVSAVVKSSGLYYPITGSGTGITLTTNGTALSNNDWIFEPGESLAISTTQNGVSAWPTLLVYPASNQLIMAKVFTLSSGTNLLYTVPNGYKAIGASVGSPYPLSSPPTVQVYNRSGGTRFYNLYLVPPGMNAGPHNKVFGVSTLDSGLGSLAGVSGLDSGYSIVVDTDSSAGTQLTKICLWVYPAE